MSNNDPLRVEQMPLNPAIRKFLEAEDLLDSDRLLALEEEAIRDLCQNFCFDTKDTIKPLKIKNRHIQLLHGHLAIEYVVTSFLDQKILRPEAVNLDRWSFRHKADLLFALGGIPEHLYEVIIQINSLRNRAVHKFGFKITNLHIYEILSKFPRDFQEKLNGGLKFDEVLGTCLFSLESHRHEHLYSEILHIRQKLRLDIAVKNYQRIRQRSDL